MPTRLFHISDVHFGIEDRAALAEVERAIADERPDALVCTGDLTQRATHRQYASAAEWFGRFDIPVWLDVGNHDMPYYNLWERFKEPYRRYNALRRAVAVDVFETDDLVLIPLRTTVPAQKRWPWSDGVVTSHSIAATLVAIEPFEADSRTVIVTAHHPLHGPEIDGPTSTIGGNEAFARLVESGMDAIMTGHIHTPFNERRRAGEGSAQVIGAGTLSTRLRHGAPPSYNVLTCARGEGDIAVETRTIPVVL
ncbi:MAG: metallophosphoesterase [Erythrobacter sp.]|uniref:metallophosphoesterase family protein n=1 Tax=Erythrobacter sp. TaxID=1042 RepID=UPI0026374818|nr:metallophosphoesterase [Erythrobacter sp.]MDJ0978502.1 metallophosphoesterase [Erythrobacter sp.]